MMRRGNHTREPRNRQLTFRGANWVKLELVREGLGSSVWCFPLGRLSHSGAHSLCVALGDLVPLLVVC
jgi:hypothetical protein